MKKLKKPPVSPPRTHLIQWRVSYLDNKVPSFCIIEAVSHKQAISSLSKQPGVKILRVRSVKTVQQIAARELVREMQTLCLAKSKQVTDVATKLKHIPEASPEVPKLQRLLNQLQQQYTSAAKQLHTFQQHKKALAGSQLLPPKMEDGHDDLPETVS